MNVWTERRTDGQNWHQCTGASYLMAFDYEGDVVFPLGLDTSAELNAFQPNVGEDYAVADAAAQKRYGRILPRPTGSLSDALNTPGLGVAVQGVNARLTTHLHRWDPPYMGGHAMFVIALGGGLVRLFDPEATAGYPGEDVAVSDILHWAYGTQGTYLIAKGVDTMTFENTYTPFVADFTAGATLYKDAARLIEDSKGWVGGTDIGVAGVGTAANPPGSPDAAILINLPAGGGARKLVYIGANHIVPGTLKVRAGTIFPVSSGGLTQADVDKAVALQKTADAATLAAAVAAQKAKSVAAVEAS